MLMIVTGPGPVPGVNYIPPGKDPALLKLSLHYAGPVGTFCLEMDATPKAPDLWPFVEQAAEKGQEFIDACATMEMDLHATVICAHCFLDMLVPKLQPGKAPHPYRMAEAVMALIILRSFGHASDDDDANGFVPLWHNAARSFPVLKWNGPTHAAGNA